MIETPEQRKYRLKYWIVYTSETDEACSHAITQDEYEIMMRNDYITIHEVKSLMP